MMILETGDILRETQISQFYRYAKISELQEAGQFCRYVGDISGFKTDRKPVVNNSYLQRVFNLK